MQKKQSVPGFNWEITQSAYPDFQWCSARSILKELGTITDKSKWPMPIDLTSIVEKIPELQEMDRRREEADKKLKKEQEEKIKRGKAEDMTVRLLREVLDEIGVHYNKTSKKADLIQKVKEARKEQSNVADISTSSHGTEMGSGSMEDTTTSKHSHSFGAHFTMDQCDEKLRKRALGWCPYYDDEKWKRFYYLLLHLLFLLEILGLYLDILTYLYVVTSIRAIMCLVGSVYFLLVLTRVLRLLFASFMFASINLVSFLYDGNEHFLPMDCQ